jgi:hypothetical protein
LRPRLRQRLGRERQRFLDLLHRHVVLRRRRAGQLPQHVQVVEVARDQVAFLDLGDGSTALPNCANAQADFWLSVSSTKTGNFAPSAAGSIRA